MPIPDDFNTQYQAEYYFDSLSGEIKQTNKVVNDKYKIQKGFVLNRSSGKFYNLTDGKEIPLNIAVKRVR